MAIGKGKDKPKRRSILNDKSLVTKQGNESTREVDTIEYQEKIEKIYGYIKDGMSSNEIYALLLSEDNSLGEDSFMQIMKHAYQWAENASHKDRDFIFQLHMDRYEKMWEKSMEMTDRFGRKLDAKVNHDDWPIICAKYVNGMKVLKSKEDLLGLHDKSIVLEFNEEKAVIVETDTDDRGKVPGVSFGNLTLEEKKELLEYIQQARTIPIEGVQRVSVKTFKIEINTDTGERKKTEVIKNIDNVQDISYEEMPEPVISKMKKPRKREDQPMPHAPIMIDEAGQETGKSLEDIQSNMKQSFIDKFRDKIKQR